jgi:hypothetical protein
MVFLKYKFISSVCFVILHQSLPRCIYNGVSYKGDSLFCGIIIFVRLAYSVQYSETKIYDGTSKWVTGLLI